MPPTPTMDTRRPRLAFSINWLSWAIAVVIGVLWDDLVYRTTVIVWFFLVEGAAVIWSRPGWLESLSQHITWVYRNIGRREMETLPWKGWNALLFTPWMLMLGYMVGDSLYDYTGSMFLALVVPSFIVYGLYEHTIAKLW